MNKTPKVYLSLDVDFWNCINDYQRSIQSFLRRIPAATWRSARIVDSHENILRYVNHADFDVLINMDYHSDMVGFDLSGLIPHFDCGSWVDYVKKSSLRTYGWIYPNYKKCVVAGDGLCHARRNALLAKERDIRNLSTTWRDVYSTNLNGAGKFEKNLVGISIAKSVDYTDPDVLKYFLKQLKIRKVQA